MKLNWKKTKKSFDFEFDITIKELSLITASIKAIILIFSYKLIFKDISLYLPSKTVNLKKNLVNYYVLNTQ